MSHPRNFSVGLLGGKGEAATTSLKTSSEPRPFRGACRSERAVRRPRCPSCGWLGCFGVMTTTMTAFGEFAGDETGAVSIDWVAITAGLLLLGIAVIYSIFGNGVSPMVGQMNIVASTGGNVPEAGKGRFQTDGRLIMADGSGKYTAHAYGSYKIFGSYYVKTSTGERIAHVNDVDW